VGTNIDLEHVDHYRDLEEIKAAFLAYMDKVPFYGAAVICLDDQNVASLIPEIGKRIITYGMTGQADVMARNIVTKGLRSGFEVWVRAEMIGEVSLALPGKHNVYNALAVIAVGLELEIPFADIAKALDTFSGVQRRLQIKGEWMGVTVIDDYGHHPTEVKATLSAIRDAWPTSRLVVLFQPHRYTRTSGLFKEFCTAFYDADLLFLADIYAAGEAPIEGVSAETLCEGIRQHGQRHVQFVSDIDTMAARIAPYLEEGDVVLTLGAGDIWRVGDQIVRLPEQVRQPETAGTVSSLS
jgi:UDP-N-acetylmuramate--alanine ligase